MDSETAWRHVDAQRRETADLIETLAAEGPSVWSSASLCTGWTVRDVAAHLTHSTLPAARILVEAARSGFRFNAAVDRMARSDSSTPHEIAAKLRAMAGSRRHPPGATVMDPLTDLLVHVQDICVPLGIERPMPTDAALAAAKHVWRKGFPFNAQRRLAGTRLVAVDVDFAVGDGNEVHAPIQDLLLMLTGRQVPVPPTM